MLVSTVSFVASWHPDGINILVAHDDGKYFSLCEDIVYLSAYKAAEPVNDGRVAVREAGPVYGSSELLPHADLTSKE
ncbi:hypothetical protein DPMN_138549 [Dreissena polymorpha]|uniref:Uncharacterized protein n=1 Tax=Dreissena polymorpha TaxID=45954 RepID=A0A9D4G7H6_DREPO|nr:hypothetical protein DPMN_138549 [Dreissena polymorpha]